MDTLLPESDSWRHHRATGERSASGEDMIQVEASERTEMLADNKNAPYKRMRVRLI